MEVRIVVIYGVVFFALLVFQNTVINNYKAFWNTISNFYYTFYTFTECFFFSLIFWINIKSRQFRILAVVIFILFTAFQIIYLFTIKSEQIDNVPVGVETLIMYVYIFFFFYSRFKNIDDQYIYNNYCFWICVGIMLYLGGSFFFFILGNHITEKQIADYWYLTYVIEIPKNILFAISLIVFSKQTKSGTSKQNIPYLDFN